MIKKHKKILRVALAVAFLLLLPFSAMQLTDEVAWSPGDFAIAGLLLFGTGLTYELVARKRETIAFRIALGASLAAALLLVWMNLAVGGLIGENGSPANLIYLGVLAVGIGGAFLARFQPEGMAWTLFATAVAHALVTVIALVRDGFGISVIANGFFLVAWSGSALLFLRANQKDSDSRPPA